MNRDELWERVVWTAVQAFFGSLPVVIALNAEELKAVGMAALVAVISSLISLGKNLTVKQQSQS